MRRKLGSILEIAFVVMLFLGVMPRIPVFSSPTTRIYLAPSDYLFDTDTVTAPGYAFNVTVRVDDAVIRVSTWQVKVFYNDTIINVTRWFEPTGDPEYVFNGKMSFPSPTPPDYDYTHSDPDVGAAMMMSMLFPPPPSQTGFTGSGILCIIEFHVTALPSEGETLSCSLSIDNSLTYLLDSEGSDIPDVTKQGGYYELRSGAVITYDATIEAYCYTEGTNVAVSITKDGSPTGYTTPHTFTSLAGSHTFTVPNNDQEGHPFIQWSTGATTTTITISSDGTFTAYYGAPVIGTRLYVDPPEIIDPTKVPSSIFGINITVDDVQGMSVCEFNLSYYSDVLSWAGIILRRVDGQIPSVTMDANDELGYIWMRFTYLNPVTTSDSIPLVTIEFHVDNFGATPLDLHDTELLDASEQPIDHEAEDGYFATQISDVAIINVVSALDWVYQGWLVDINVTAKNLGNVDETFDVMTCYDDNPIETLPVVDLAPDAEITLTFTWNTSLVTSCNNYTISGNATIGPYELNITNNGYIDGTIKVRLMGDVNWDDHVDGLDLYVTAQAFGSDPGHPRWNPNVDLNQDLFIDALDLYITAINYGKACPP